jgi:hypothetical protein
MAITQAMPTSFKVEILQAVHNFGPTSGNTFKIALYTSSATLSAATTVYSSSNEVSSTNYTAGGNTLTVSVTPTSTGTTAFISFTSPTTWSGVTFTARGALIYNSTQGNKAVAVIDFGAYKNVSGVEFNVIFTTANSN